MSLLSAVSEDDGGGWVESSGLKRYQTSRQGRLATERPDEKVTAEGEGGGAKGRSPVDVKLCLQSNQGEVLTSDQLATI